MFFRSQAKTWLVCWLLFCCVVVQAEPLDLQAVLSRAADNNPTLQASYANVNIAQARVRQANLLQNPNLGVELQWPIRGGGGTTQEYTLSYNIIDLFQRPSRRRIAELRRDATLAETLRQAVDIEADIKNAYYSVQGHAQSLEEQKTLIKIADLNVQLAQRQREAGNIPAIELAQKKAVLVQARIQLYNRQQALFEERQHLAQLMGEAENGQTLMIVAQLPDLPEADSETAPALVAEALAQRSDLAAQRYEIEALRKDRGQQNLLVFDETNLGYIYERDIAEIATQGFDFSIPVPIFDRRQGHKDRLDAQIDRQEALERSLSQKVIADVKTLLIKMANARLRVEQLEELVPLRQEILELSQLEYNAMLIGTYQLLDTRGDGSLAMMTLADAKADYWRARTDLERALSRSVLEGSVPFDFIEEKESQS